MCGRVDAAGRLVSADPRLENLQREAGSQVGQALALPQVAAVAHLARKLGIPVARPAVAASADQDFDLWVKATPDGEDVLLAIEGWSARQPAGPRLAGFLGGNGESEASQPHHEWAADEELRIISLSPELADYLGVDVGEAAGQPLTRILRLEEDEAGEMPLLSAVAGRKNFSAQNARSRADQNRTAILNGEVVNGADGNFAGFRGSAQIDHQESPTSEPHRSAAFDDALNEALRSPLDRIIETAERIVARSDGPLRSDYASYGGDIAAAAQHLLSVIESMRRDAADSHRTIDLAALAGEAVILLEPAAEHREVTITLEAEEPLQANGEERAVIQILVNLLGNAVRHSPKGGTVRLSFARTSGTSSVTVADEGAGIDPADQQRIFERFERADAAEGGTGLGLAISRRLARSMGGEVSLESAPGGGARFTLTLPNP